MYHVGDYPNQQYLRGTQKQCTITSSAKDKQQIMFNSYEMGLLMDSEVLI